MVDGGEKAVDRVRRYHDGEDWSCGSSDGPVPRVETECLNFVQGFKGINLFSDENCFFSSVGGTDFWVAKATMKIFPATAIVLFLN